MTQKRTRIEKKRVVIYTRVSRDDTGEGRSVERQLEACRKLAELRGWVVVHELSDNSISAWSGTERPAWREVLKLVELGEVDIVVAWHIDRMTRSMLDLEQLIVLAERQGVGVATATGDIDLTTDVGRMVARILAAVARAEVERKAARQRLANDQRATEGLPHTAGARPFGYADDHVTVVPVEADMIRSAVDRVLAGASIRSIAREWTSAGFTSSRGSGWTPEGVKQLLVNPRYAGIRVHRGEEVGKAAWEPVLELDAHLAVKAKLTAPDRLSSRAATGRTPANLLTGIIRCQVCDTPLRASSAHSKLTYSCRPAGHVHIPRDVADDYVGSAVVALLSQPDVLSELVVDEDDELDRARATYDDARERLDGLAEAYAAGAITLEQLTTGSVRLREALGQAEDTLARSTAGAAVRGLPVGTTQIEGKWLELELSRRRALVELLFTVRALPANGYRGRFDPELRLKVARVRRAEGKEEAPLDDHAGEVA